MAFVKIFKRDRQEDPELPSGDGWSPSWTAADDVELGDSMILHWDDLDLLDPNAFESAGGAGDDDADKGAEDYGDHGDGAARDDKTTAEPTQATKTRLRPKRAPTLRHLQLRLRR